MFAWPHLKSETLAALLRALISARAKPAPRDAR